MDIQKLFTALTTLNFSQNSLAKSFGTSVSTINGWIHQNRQPRLTAQDIYDCIDDCRHHFSSYQKDSVFVDQLIEKLDISAKEKAYLSSKYMNYKLQDLPEEKCYKDFMIDLIQMSLNKEGCPEITTFDPSNTTPPIVGIGIEHIAAVRDDGRVYSTGANDYQQCATHAWRDIVSVSAGWRSTVGLKKDGTCIAIGRNIIGDGEIFRWTNIISIDCGPYHTIGLKSDGSAVAFGMGGYGQCNLESWKDLQAVAAGDHHSVGLKKNGTVIAVGGNDYGQCDVASWTNVTAIAAGGNHTIGLTSDGRILAAGDVETFHFDNWNNIISIAAGSYHVVGLKSDGTVVATGHQANGQCDVYRWSDMIAVYAGFFKTVGIKQDGHVVSTICKHERSSGYTNTSSWQLFKPTKAIANEISQFEKARLNTLNSLAEIKQQAAQCSPHINAYAYPSHGYGASRTEELDVKIHTLYTSSKHLWETYQTLTPLPPIDDLILKYCAAFTDFYNTLNVIKSNTENEQIPLYELTSTSYDTFVTLLMIIQQTIRDLENLQ